MKSMPILRAVAVPVLLLVALSGLAYATYASFDFESDETITRVFLCAFVVAGALLAQRLTSVILLDVVVRHTLRREVPRILHDMNAVVWALVALGTCFQVTFKIAAPNMLALSGVMGVVIGLALRPIILDVFSGLSTNLEAAFQLGDFITVESDNHDFTGWVDQINWRTTHIRTRAGDLVVTPNSVLSTSVVTNHSRPYRMSRYEIFVHLPPEVPTERARTILQTAADATLHQKGGPNAAKRPDVLITEVHDSGVKYWVRFWLDPSVESYDTAIHLINASIMQHLRVAGIRLASQREIHLNDDAPVLAADLHNAEDRVAVLAPLELFAGVSPQALQQLAAQMVVENHDDEAVLVAEGDDSTHMAILVEGQLEVMTESANGETLTLGRLQPGDFFGEMSLLTGEPRSASVLAVASTRTLQIGREAIRAAIETEPTLLHTLSKNLAARKLEREARLQDAEDMDMPNADDLAETFFLRMKRVFSATSKPFRTNTPVQA